MAFYGHGVTSGWRRLWSFQRYQLSNRTALFSQFASHSKSTTTVEIGKDNALDRLLKHRTNSKITWYSCGPTVYDAAHIGHARTYVCTDIIRRILEDELGHEVDYAIGVTDIDDKIIQRAFSNGLNEWSQMVAMVRSLEADFFHDLDALHVRRPNAVLRVTEHINDIITYIQKIISTGRAYVTPEGVYFDVSSCGEAYLYFRERGLPDMSTSTSPAVPQQEGVAVDVFDVDTTPGNHKRDPRDFALWKAVKTEASSSGEPKLPGWESPWGFGRPGWHIECSAVTHAYFGSTLDIHSGGIDLKFPHHTNEIAQCTAHNCSTHGDDWVQLWLHTGHLYIEGRKMSKSLKNFISIKEFLEGGYSSNPAADFRIFCLQHKYDASIHFSPLKIDNAGTFRRKVEGFLRLAESIQSNRLAGDKDQDAETGYAKRPTNESRKMMLLLSTSRAAARVALVNDFDTPEALRCISSLVGEGTLYASMVANQRTEPLEPLMSVARYVLDVLGKMGLTLLSNSSSSTTDSSNNSSIDTSSAVSGEAAIETLLTFRSKVRAASLSGTKSLKAARKRTKSLPSDDDTVDSAATAIAKNEAVIEAGESLGKVLEACDWVRNTACPAMGVQIDDVSETLSTWRKITTSD